MFFLQVPIPGLVEGSTKRKRILSPEELEDRRKRREEAAAKRKRLLEEKRKKKEEAEHKKKYVGKIPWRRKWQTTPVLLPGKSHGLRSLVGYGP